MTGASASTLPSDVSVTFRRMKFDLEEVPKYWHSGSPFLSHFFNALSLVFPEGERFFIESVKRYEDEIVDPATRAELKGFVKQEAHHGLQHELYNQMMKRHGIAVDDYERSIKRLIDLARRVFPYKTQLAVTIALEHFTATMADVLLTNPRITDGMHPAIKPLWQWHAIEETEHKAVCFDVYQQIDGGYGRRVATMCRAMIGFPLGITLITLSLLAFDRKLFAARDFARGIRFLWGRGGVVRLVAPGIRQYFRRDFTPWEVDNRRLIEAWKRDNGRYIVSASSETALPLATAPTL